uniref:UTP25 C-terminal domain-containing protein n=1 Tax=Medicago truncatula TaxID=3880 RepID=I3SHC4_MEDTR|nr:unknown [Medicago truncatula]
MAKKDIFSARRLFTEGKRKIMLCTERAHFYHRFKNIRGVKNLIMYSHPERKEFYPEIANLLDGSENPLCTALFSRLDRSRLERIVGTTWANRMVFSTKPVFVFCY